ncbi:MAG: hypothetical protein RR704_19915, partial [Stenotrophomonas sp.]
VAELHAAIPGRIPFVQQLRLYLGAETQQGGRPYCIAVLLGQDALCWLDASRNRMLYAEPASRSVACLRRLLQDTHAPVSLHPLSREDFEQKVAAGRALSIGPTLWTLGLEASVEGSPLPPLALETRLKLSRWPDFRILGNRHDDFRLCALLIKHGLDVATCGSVLGLSQQHVQAFFNAAYLSGYAFPARDTARAVRTGAQSRLAGLWRQIRVHWSH